MLNKILDLNSSTQATLGIEPLALALELETLQDLARILQWGLRP